MKLNWSKLRNGAWLPLLAVVLLVFVSQHARNEYILCKTGHCSESVPDNLWKVLKVDPKGEGPLPSNPSEVEKEIQARDIRDRKSAGLKYGGRMTWSFLAVANVLIYVASVAVVLMVLYRLFSRRRATCLAVLVFSASILVVIVMYCNRDLHMALFEPLFQQTIVNDVPRIVEITNRLNSLGNGAAFLLILTSCAILLRDYRSSAPNGLTDLSTSMKSLRFILYVGTCLLVAAVLLKKSLYQWSLAFASRDEQLAKVGEAFLSSFLSVEGGFYTLMLAAMYLPAAYVLYKRAWTLKNLPEEETKKEEMLKEHGMTFSLTESLPRILAILGPLLAGPIGDLLKGVS
jgi:hypothetical protein